MSTASSTSGASRASGSPVEQRALLTKNYPVKFVLPAAIILVIFFFVPTVLNFVYAFTDWSAFKTTIEFNGLDNFTSLFSNGMLLRDLRITLIFAVCVAFFQNTFGLALAVFLEKDTIENQIARVLFFIPVLMSALAVGYVWQAMLKSNGAVNQILSAIVGHTVATPWLGSTTWSIVLVSAIQGWKWAGLAMLIYLAGLKTIDQDVLEAAAIDGGEPLADLLEDKVPAVGSGADVQRGDVAAGFDEWFRYRAGHHPRRAWRFDGDSQPVRVAYVRSGTVFTVHDDEPHPVHCRHDHCHPIDLVLA